MGRDSCYPLAFGVPAGLMVAAIIVFLSGSFWYKKVPPKENIFGEVLRVIKVRIGAIAELISMSHICKNACSTDYIYMKTKGSESTSTHFTHNCRMHFPTIMRCLLVERLLLMT